MQQRPCPERGRHLFSADLLNDRWESCVGILLSSLKGVSLQTLPFTGLRCADVLYQSLILRIAQSPADLVFPLRLDRTSVGQAHYSTLFREVVVHRCIETLGPDDAPLRDVIPDKPNDQRSHAEDCIAIRGIREPFANRCEFDQWLPKIGSRRHTSLMGTK